MRVIVFFDLPSVTSVEKKEYRAFRKFLLSVGFIMMQESVYSKIVLNATAQDTLIINVIKNKPSEGLVQILSITEKQFQKIKCIVGERKTDIIDTDERLIII